MKRAKWRSLDWISNAERERLSFMMLAKATNVG